MATLWDMEAQGRKILLDSVVPLLDGTVPRVLDVGCGSGELLRELTSLKPGVETWGVDPYAWDTDRGPVRCRRVSAERIADLGLEFGVVYNVMSLHHFPSVPAFLDAAWDVLVPEGHLVIVDWKHGVDTGIPERYFPLDEIRSLLNEFRWQIRTAREHRWHFEIVATRV